MGRSPGNFESLKPEDEMFSDFCHTVIQHTNNIRLRLSVSVKPAQALGAASDIAAQPGLSFLRGAKTKSTPPRKTRSPNEPESRVLISFLFWAGNGLTEGREGFKNA